MQFYNNLSTRLEDVVWKNEDDMDDAKWNWCNHQCCFFWGIAMSYYDPLLSLIVVHIIFGRFGGHIPMFSLNYCWKIEFMSILL